MISVLKNEHGLIYAYIEWYVLDEKAQFKDYGDYIYIQDSWIHPEHRGNGCLRNLIHLIDIHEYTKNAKYVYWEREKYNHKLSKIYNRKIIAKQGA